LLKKSITYENPFTQQEVTEEHYFHISKADMVEMEMEEQAEKYTKWDKVLNKNVEFTGMQAKIQRLVDSEDGKTIMTIVKDLILRAYGKKEGDRFIKSKANREEFEGTEAFSQLLFDLCTNASDAAQFASGVLPSNADLERAAAKNRAAQPTPNGSTPVAAPEVVDHVVPEVLSVDDAAEMDKDELAAGLISGKYKLS
jgi:hypothetical protein